MSTAAKAVTQPVRFPLYGGALLCLALLLGEHHLPADVMYHSSVDAQIAAFKGGALHEISYLLIGALGVYWIFQSKQRIRFREGIFPWVLGALVAFCAASVLWAQEPDVSGKRLIALGLMILGATGATLYWPKKSIVAFIAICAAIHLTVGLGGELAASHFTPWESDYRFAGTLFWNQQGFSCLVLALSSCAAMELLAEFRKTFLFLFGYGVVFLVLTKSRSSLLGLALGMGCYLFITRSARAKVGIALSVILTSILLYTTGVMDRLSSSVNRSGEGSENLTGRIPLWQECMEFVKAHPIAGYGYENFWTAANIDYFSKRFHWSISAAHSAYLETLLTIGGIGLILQVLVLLIGVGKGVSLYRSTGNPIYVLVSSLCVTYLVVGFLEAIMVVKLSPYSFYLWLLLLQLSLRSPQEEQIKNATAAPAAHDTLTPVVLPC